MGNVVHCAELGELGRPDAARYGDCLADGNRQCCAASNSHVLLFGDIVRWLATSGALIMSLLGLATASTIAAGLLRILRSQRSGRRGRVVRVMGLIVSVLSFIISGGIFLLHLRQLDVLPINATMPSRAWVAFNKGNYSAVIAEATSCISQLQSIADRHELQLENDHISIPPAGIVTKNEEAAIFARGPVNDVATCLYLKGNAEERIGRKEEARFAYEAAAKYRYARAWDPNGWFWSAIRSCGRAFEPLKVRGEVQIFRGPAPRAALPLSDDPLAHGVQNKLGHAVQVQLLQDVRAMGFHRVQADIQHVGDFLVGAAFREKLQDLALASGDQFISVLGAPALQLAHVVFHQDLADCGAEKRFAFGQRAHGRQQVGFGGIL